MNGQSAIKLTSFILLLFILHIFYLNISSNEQNTKWIDNLDESMYADQLVIVIVSEEKSLLSFFEKDSKGKWLEILTTPAIIGKNGIGKTKEGDMKTPIGTYRFVKAFGIQEDPGAKMDYIQVEESHYWVDDSDSKFYNQFVSTKEVKRDWVSAEHICEYGELYNYVLATSYNEECVPGVGSAVFLHCASEETEYTAGCVAIQEKYMREIIRRVKSDCVLIIDTDSRIKNY